MKYVRLNDDGVELVMTWQQYTELVRSITAQAYKDARTPVSKAVSQQVEKPKKTKRVNPLWSEPPEELPLESLLEEDIPAEVEVKKPKPVWK